MMIKLAVVIITTFAAVWQCAIAAPTTQLSIDRVELMPNEPKPFKLKDFQAVARGYDKLAFDFSASGKFMPVIWWDDTKINFPMRTFGMPSYVGKKQAMAGDDHEAITTIGSVLGATMAGIDKASQEHNWVDQCAAYFNTRTEQFVILNNISTESGKTYWYETFPQILFNMLVDRYPKMQHGEMIMRRSADRWHEAVESLQNAPGGLSFDHTAFNLRTMTPFDNGKWREPDGAAGIAYIQYSAYRKSNDEKYLKTANVLIDYLDGRTTSPLYEINLPFGAYVAARLNAEHDANHDLGRLLNWCFNPSDTRPGWGVIVGNWGGYEVSGLAGSVSDGGGYGFVMNTYAMGGALTPIARYDDRYARAIGKWMLNAMNAVRLCYQDELPRELQSCPDFQTSPPNVIPYEGIRKLRNGRSPYASGDPLVAGWGETDLGLYGGGFVGFFAGIIKPTNEPMIPQLNLLATDCFRAAAYPSFLYYNPHADERSIEVDVGAEGVDVYNAVQNDFIVIGATRQTKFALAPDSAAVIVLVPAGKPLRHDGRRTFAGDVVIDYDNGRVARPPPPAPPRRTDESRALKAGRATIEVDGNPSDWSAVKSDRQPLDTADRGTMKADLRFAWDETNLYAVVEQTAKSSRTHEAANVEAFQAAPWDFDGVWLHLAAGNGRIPSIGDAIVSMAYSSNSERGIFNAPALGNAKESGVVVATSGQAEAGNRVIEVKIPWASLLGHAFNGSKNLLDQFGPVRAGVRIGCEASMLEYNHTGQSFIGGAQYKKPDGFDANSRDIELHD